MCLTAKIAWIYYSNQLSFVNIPDMARHDVECTGHAAGQCQMPKPKWQIEPKTQIQYCSATLQGRARGQSLALHKVMDAVLGDKCQSPKSKSSSEPKFNIVVRPFRVVHEAKASHYIR